MRRKRREDRCVKLLSRIGRWINKRSNSLHDLMEFAGIPEKGIRKILPREYKFFVLSRHDTNVCVCVSISMHTLSYFSTHLHKDQFPLQVLTTPTFPRAHLQTGVAVGSN